MLLRLPVYPAWRLQQRVAALQHWLVPWVASQTLATPTPLRMNKQCDNENGCARNCENLSAKRVAGSCRPKMDGMHTWAWL